MFLSGVQNRIRLDSRLKHAAMTDFALASYFTRQAAGSEASGIQVQTASETLLGQIFCVVVLDGAQ
jgi:hypothetical protein